MGDGLKKPRLVPHSRSPLAFLTECIRLREWELTTFPTWADPETVSAILHDNLGPYDRDPFATGIAERHIKRHKAKLAGTRTAVAANLSRLAPDVTVPDTLIDTWTAQRFALKRVQAALKAQTGAPAKN